jgi:hypothetical protein
VRRVPRRVLVEDLSTHDSTRERYKPNQPNSGKQPVDLASRGSRIRPVSRTGRIPFSSVFIPFSSPISKLSEIFVRHSQHQGSSLSLDSSSLTGNDDSSIRLSEVGRKFRLDRRNNCIARIRAPMRTYVESNGTRCSRLT